MTNITRERGTIIALWKNLLKDSSRPKKNKVLNNIDTAYLSTNKRSEQMQMYDKYDNKV